jgi:AcrR family transcriptional regulator
MARARRAPSQAARRSPRVAQVRTENNGGSRVGHAHIAQIQRARILTAMFDVVAERGASNVSVAHVVERSGVSRRTFYEAFSDREDCFLAAFDDALAFASQRVLPAYAAERKWCERIRAGLVALLGFLDEEPVVGRLLIVESLACGEKALQRRNNVMAHLVAAVEEGRQKSKAGSELPALTGEGAVGGALSIIQALIVNTDHEPLIQLVNPLMGMIVLPYLGSAAARRELDRPIAPRVSNASDTRLLTDPFKDAGMRLTYRTVRVLITVAEQPKASNRTIGEVAGITDQGQISKLLSRLQRLDLITNIGLEPGQGAPNVWLLTATGRRLVDSIRTHTGTPHGVGQASAHTDSSKGNGGEQP